MDRRRLVDAITPDEVRSIYREFLERDPAQGEIETQMTACRTARELLEVVRSSAEYGARLRTRGETPAAAAAAGRPRVNIWRPELAEWSHQPGTVSEDGVAIVGHEGWLFIKGGTNSTLDQHRGEDAPSAAWLDAWTDGLAVRRDEAKELGLELVTVVMPDKLAIHEEHFPEPIDPIGPRPVLRLRERAGKGLLYPLQELRSARSGGDVALRTDTHLTARGNLVLAAAVTRRLGLADPDPALIAQPREHVFSGDLGTHFTPRIVEVARTPIGLGDAEMVADNRDAIAAVDGHVGTRRVLRNGSAPDARVAVLFGDSYGCPWPYYQGLGWWLAQAFAEVHFVWVPFGWDPAYLREAGAQVAVVQTSERFVGRVPLDRVDVTALMRATIESGQPAGLDSFCRVV